MAAQNRPFNGRTEYYRRTLGSSFLKIEAEDALVIGKDSWTRHELATKLGCAHLTAARLLTKNLKTHGIDSIKELFQTTPEQLVALAGVGAMQVYVAMCALDARGYNAAKWYRLDDDTVSVHALKDRQRRLEHEAA